MDADQKRHILEAEARAELIATLVGRGFYVYSPDEVAMWDRCPGMPGAHETNAPQDGDKRTGQ